MSAVHVWMLPCACPIHVLDSTPLTFFVKHILSLFPLAGVAVYCHTYYLERK